MPPTPTVGVAVRCETASARPGLSHPLELAFAVGQPGVMGGLVPYWLTGGWDGSGAALVLQVAGPVLLATGVGALAHTVIRFAVEGLGTPFPAAPTEKLVVGGLYRHVRNPMYLAVIAIVHRRPTERQLALHVATPAIP